ncbi:MAG: lipocalin family protein [Gammaproteobacteria bacterium]|nr:lipocalin family protein [Gammaproteobacteria bacterium]
MLTPEVRSARLRAVAVAAAAAILSGCASAPPSSNAGLQAVYCINAQGAQAPPPDRVPAAYCVNLEQAAAGKVAAAAGAAAREAAPKTPPHPAVPEHGPVGKPAESTPATGQTQEQAKSQTPAATAGSALPQAFSFDLDRYMGRWYVIANIPSWVERGNVGSYAEYRKHGDGDIDDLYFYHPRNFDEPLQEKQGLAHVVDGSGGTHWRVTFFWPIYVDYQVLYVDPDYNYALVGNSDKSLGWVFARKPAIDADTYSTLLAKFAALGYDTNKFKRVPQTPAQIGQPGT